MNNINIILTRHGRYNCIRDRGDLRGGHITNDGEKEIQDKTKKRINRIVGDNLLNTIFLVVGSPTYWLSNESLGQRAVETEIITKNTIKDILKENGVDEENVEKYFYSEQIRYSRNKNGISIQEIADYLSEPNVYDEAPKYIEKLKLKHGGMNSSFWRELSSSEEVKDYNKNAESPSVLTKKIKKVLNYVIDWAKDYSALNSRDVCVILITHGETMEPFINNQKLVNIANFGYNGGIVFEVKEDGIIVKTENEEFIGPPKKIENKVLERG